MQEITVVTTFHKEGLDLYGQRFLYSFAKNVDQRIKMLVYAEDCNPINPNPMQITILDAKQTISKLNEFKERWKNDSRANGVPPDNIKAKRPKDWHKKFKWDAIRFANKTYAVFDAAQRCNSDWLVWMDADTYVHSEWSYKNFKKQLPDDVWITYVGRGKGSQTWPECGFYGMNLNNHQCNAFLKEFERMYDDAENGIFKLEEWHDSYVFGEILNVMKVHNPAVLDYSAEMYLKEAKTGGGGHPLINTELGRWIDHMKGNRKTTKKSLAKDLMVNRTEEYWNV
jgi:hypothetical protein